MSNELTPLASLLARDGIAIVPDVFSVNDLAEMNFAMNPLFKARAAEVRSYVRPNDMLEAGILDLVLSPAMKDVILSVVPDPVLYHLHAVETAGNSAQPHIFGDRLDGWHRDDDCAFFEADPTHVSIFVYLSGVGADDGPFEFCLQQPPRLHPSSPVATMEGPAGFSFVWQRGFYHRAAPNRGNQRRRLLKVSIQPNQFPSLHLARDFFSGAIAAAAHRDTFHELMFGLYQGRSAPSLQSRTTVTPETVNADRTLNLPPDTWVTPVGEEAGEQTRTAYD